MTSSNVLVLSPPPPKKVRLKKFERELIKREEKASIQQLKKKRDELRDNELKKRTEKPISIAMEN